MSSLLKSARAVAKIAKDKVGALVSVVSSRGTVGTAKSAKSGVEVVIIPPRQEPRDVWLGGPYVMPEPPRKEFRNVFSTREGWKREKMDGPKEFPCRTTAWEKMFF